MTPMPLEGGFPQSLQPFPMGDSDSLFLLRKSRSRGKHLLVASIASLAAMCLLAVIIFHGYVAWMLAFPFVAPLSSNPQAAIGLDYEDVIFPSKSGDTTVSGWFIPAEADAGEPQPRRGLSYSAMAMALTAKNHGCRCTSSPSCCTA